MDSRNLINGEWVIPEGTIKEVWNPANTTVKVGTLHCSGPEHVKHAVDAARLAFKDWSRRTGAGRADFLYKISSLMETHREELAKLASS